MAPAALVEASMVTVGTKNLVWVRIRTFLAGTQGAVEAAIDAHRQDSSARIDGWILDLRGNPGGVGAALAAAAPVQRLHATLNAECHNGRCY